MDQSEIFSMNTIHGTQIFVSAALKLIQRPAESNEMPLYAKRADGGICLFMLKNGVINYVVRIKADFTVELGAEPVFIKTIDNPDGTVTIPIGKRFFSPRKDGSFSTVPKNLGWEHIKLLKSSTVDVSGENIFSMRTSHRTSVLLDARLRLHHAQPPGKGDLMLYARMDSQELNFFVVKNGGVKYVRSFDRNGVARLSDKKYPFPFVYNVTYGSFHIVQDGQYWSARKDSGKITTMPHNQAWEHFFFDKVSALSTGKRDVVLMMSDAERLDDAIRRLNLDRVNIKSVLIGNANDEQLDSIAKAKKLPVMPLERAINEERESFYLLSIDNPGTLKDTSRYLQSHGIARDNIISIEPKMKITPTWGANLKYAINSDCNFIATGGLEMAVGLDIAQIVGKKGVNLSAEGQDLYQSYLIVKHVLEHKRSFDFVMLSLTSKSLCSNDEEYFYDHGLDCRYVFGDVESTFENKLIDEMIDNNIALPTTVSDPNCVQLKASVEQDHIPRDRIDGDNVAVIREKNIRTLENIIRLCNDAGVKAVGVTLPSLAQNAEHLELLRHVTRGLEEKYDFAFIDLSQFPLSRKLFTPGERVSLNARDDAKMSDLPFARENFYGNGYLTFKGAKSFSTLLYYKLCFKNVLPADNLLSMNYEQLYNLQYFMFRQKYEDFKSRVFDLAIERIRRKDKIRVGFVLHDSAIWCGDLLYDFFEQNDRYEPTVFFFLQQDGKSELYSRRYTEDIALFKSKGFNVLNVNQSEIVGQKIAQQDFLIYLNPYFRHMPIPLRLTLIKTDTLVVYTSYSIDVSAHSVTRFSIFSILYKIFATTKFIANTLEKRNYLGVERIVYSGHPKLDVAFNKPDLQFDWKMTHPNALKIIWAPHHSIRQAGKLPNQATFQWNYKFFYEYAKAHPETSWIVKPHQNLLSTAVREKVFPTVEAFKEYLRQWDELPNAKVVMGAYYHSIFATSDGMIHDCGSFIAEYQYFNKPMLFLTRSDATKCNPLGQRIIDANYHVDGKDFEGIEHFIEDVLINKNDPQAEARQKVFDEELNYYKDNGMLASEKIFRTIDDALTP